MHIEEHNSACGGLSGSLTSPYPIPSMHVLFLYRGAYFKVALQIFVLQTEVDLPQATFTDTVRFRMAS